MKSRKMEALARTVEKLSKLSDQEFFDRVRTKKTTPFVETLIMLYGSDLGWGINEDVTSLWNNTLSAGEIKIGINEHNDGSKKEDTGFWVNMDLQDLDFVTTASGKMESATSPAADDNYHYDMAA